MDDLHTKLFYVNSRWRTYKQLAAILEIAEEKRYKVEILQVTSPQELMQQLVVNIGGALKANTANYPFEVDAHIKIDNILYVWDGEKLVKQEEVINET